MKRKYILILGIAVIIAAALAVYWYIPVDFGIPEKGVSSVLIKDGRTGEEANITDLQEILHLQKMLDSVEPVRTRLFSLPSGGYMYKIDVFGGDKLLKTIFINSAHALGYTHEVASGSIDIEYLSSLFG